MKSKRSAPGKKLARGTTEDKATAESAAASGHRKVLLELDAPEAREVFVAGSFDDWKCASLPMVRLDSGLWVKELVLEPGEYEYLFVVDGRWTPDPQAPRTSPNPFGGVNSCLTVV